MSTQTKTKSFTEEQINLLKDTTKSARELGEYFGVHRGYIQAWRKELGIKVPMGSKKGVPKLSRRNGSYKSCKVCGTQMYTCATYDKKYCSRKCMYECNEYIQKLKEVDKSYMQTEEYKDKHRKLDTQEYKSYAGAVHRLSQKIYEQNIDKINPKRYPRTVAGVKGGYQLDHIISVRFGFDNNIPIEVICDVSNLRMLPWQKNLARNKKN